MRLRRPQDSCLVLALFMSLLVVLWLLVGTQTARGQTPKPSEPPSLTVLLASCEQNLATLAARLEERTLQVADLRENLQIAEKKLTASQESLTALREQLATAELSQTQLQTDLSAMQSSYSALSTQYASLEVSWQAYRDEMRGQVDAVELERDRARVWTRILSVTTITGAVLAFIFALR